MAERKSTKKTASKAVPAEVLSDQEKVLQKFESAECLTVKSGFAVFDDEKPVHSGLAKSESNAWKLAAHAVA